MRLFILIEQPFNSKVNTDTRYGLSYTIKADCTLRGTKLPTVSCEQFIAGAPVKLQDMLPAFWICPGVSAADG
jgi:hypothetical protein